MISRNNPRPDGPKLYSYVVDIDTGFAPNPHHGYSTLACCKPEIRKSAKVGDLIIGAGSASKGRRGRVVYVMQVSETMGFQEYWDDPRFEAKRPRMDAGPIEAVGDKIYHWNELTGEWIQNPSQHSNDDCSPCGSNMSKDLRVNRVLIGEVFTYWGGDGPLAPHFPQAPLYFGRAHKHNYPPDLVRDFEEWYDGLGTQGVVGEPADLAIAEAQKAALFNSLTANRAV